MSCVGVSHHVDSEREEGEIIDDLDVSDISSEEEYLLRQRLEVLENYNNVLERKEAKRASIGRGYCNNRVCDNHINRLSDISAANFNDHLLYPKVPKHSKYAHHKAKKKKMAIPFRPSLTKSKEHRKKQHKVKRKPAPKVVIESSDESDYEYRNKRRKLENAVLVCKDKTDSSLKVRLMKMFNDKGVVNNKVETLTLDKHPKIKNDDICMAKKDLSKDQEQHNLPTIVEHPELIEVSTDSDTQIIEKLKHADAVDCNVDSCKANVNSLKLEEGSDEDLELLRQHALNSKPVKTQEIIAPTGDSKQNILSEDEDSDTAELRVICLKSAVLKKVIEMKQKQKMRKRLSQSSTLFDDIMSIDQEQENIIENNTDIESVDMEIGSDGADNDGKSLICENIVDINNDKGKIQEQEKHYPYKENVAPVEDDFEEDEDLLRAKLLTSLSKNLPLFVPNVEKKDVTQSTEKVEGNAPSKTENNLAEERRFIINTGGSDSEGEHEATKNLTKMHLKLSEQVDFQQKLDTFLKSTRMEVEKKLPDTVQQPSPTKTPKFVPKAVNHLPKSEQIEYKKLVKRMAELEKMRQTRQGIVSSDKAPELFTKETLKPRNVTMETKLISQNVMDEQIALSRKRIAEESAKVLQLREEGTKLSQKYNIVATELRNLSTAITFNKKQQRAAQNKLSKIRMQHQALLKRSTSTQLSQGINSIQRQQKPLLKHQIGNTIKPVSLRNASVVNTIKVSVVNDCKENAVQNVAPVLPTITISVEANDDKKTVKIGKDDVKSSCSDKLSTDNPRVGIETTDKGGGTSVENNGNDYQSPLQALEDQSWLEDLNGVLCPFEMRGVCKDAACKYLHPRSQHTQ